MKHVKSHNYNGKNHKNSQGNYRKINAIHQSKIGTEYKFEIYIYV